MKRVDVTFREGHQNFLRLYLLLSQIHSYMSGCGQRGVREGERVGRMWGQREGQEEGGRERG